LLVFTKLLLIFAIIMMVAGVAAYYTGYHFSGNSSLVYYPGVGGSPSVSANNYIQNGNTTIKYLGILMIAVGVLFLAGAMINQAFMITDKYHNLKYSKPLH
jgi:hypothetical protein